MPPHTQGEPPNRGGSTDGFEEYRVRRPDEDVLQTSLGDVAELDERLTDRLGGAA
jgi:hypothetical protein